jgi:predicted O-methyltransferase YrrM
MKAGYVTRGSANILRHPIAGIERVRGRLDRHKDRRALAAAGLPPVELYQAIADCRPRLHEAIGAAWPCSATASFDEVWSGAIGDISAAGLRTGLASYAGWNDGDRAQAEAIWCLVSHLQPQQVVETGVAHGITSRVVLEGLQRNGSGQLCSVDLPAVDPQLHSEIGVAVPASLRSRWTYVAGTSRQQLPRIMREVAQLDLFLHDSLHTQRNLCFELDVIWPALRAGGVAVVDDIDHSLGFMEFVGRAKPAVWIAAQHVTGDGLWGIAIKPSSASDGSSGSEKAN